MKASRILHSLPALNTLLKEEKASSVCIVTSSALKNKLGWALKEINSPFTIALLPDGEEAKEWKEIEKLLKKFVHYKLDRNSIVIALGGGTIGDTVGFAASIYLRGIRYIQVPTTLVAQVDSAHGGKTGINFSNYKNQIGSFHVPIATIIETRFIHSLSREQVIDGLGEIIKSGLIKDASILRLLQNETVLSLIKSPRLPHIITKTISVKNYYVSKDFKDSKERQLLNVGHTFGHAIELKYKISHGKAVLIGMLQELAFTESLGLSDASVRVKLSELLMRLGISIDTNMKANWKTILHDKKIKGNKIEFPTIEQEGKSTLITLDLETLKTFL